MKKKRLLDGLIIALALLCCGGFAACGEKHNHAYVTQVTEPTCTAWGYTTYTCECGDSYVDDYVEALGHSYNDGRVILAPTCEETGIKLYTCTRCSAAKSEEIPATGHTYVTQVTAPTCTEQGYTTYTCSCGDSYVDDYVEATGHTYAEEWTFDETYHWHAANCGKAEHAVDKAEHSLQGGTDCSVCAFTLITPAEYFTFTLKVDDTYEITAKDKNNLPAEIVLPSVYEGKAVTSIGGWAFFDCSRLTSVVIPDSVTSIGKEAFADCYSLTSVTFENPNGWWRSDDSMATSGTSIPSDDLSDPATAATYLTSTYYDYYWKRS